MGEAWRYEDNIKEWTRQLVKAGHAIQEAAANTLNLGAAFVGNKYKETLGKNFKLRNRRFTFGAIRVMKSRAMRGCHGRELRPLHGMNAIVGVDNMKGGELHYLAKQETGVTVHGARQTGGRVAVPLTAARGSGSDMSPVAPRYRMRNAKIMGIWNIEKLNPRQQYGALRDRGLRGEIRKGERIVKGILYMTNLGIFDLLKKKNHVTAVRNAEQTQIILRGRHYFEQSVSALTGGRMANLFVLSVKKLLAGIK